MVDAVYIPEKKLDKILSILDALKVEIKELKSNGQKEPPYGSDEWWEWSDKIAKQEIREGNYYETKNKKELKEFLDNIKKGRPNARYHHKVLKQS